MATLLSCLLWLLGHDQTTSEKAQVPRAMLKQSALFAGLFAMLLCAPAAGQEQADPLTTALRCRSIDDSAARLACLDAALAAEPDQRRPQANVGRWRPRVARDLISGRERISILQNAIEINGAPGSTPSLVIRCGFEGTRLEVFYSPGIQISRSRDRYARDIINIVMRFGEDVAGGGWRPSTTRDSVFSDDPRGFFERASRHSRFALGVTDPETRAEVAAEFISEGIDELRDLLKPCLPILPEPEILREIGAQIDRWEYYGAWHIVPKERLSAGTSPNLLAYYGEIQTETGQQPRMLLYCDSANLVAQVRVQRTPSFDVREAHIIWIGGGGSDQMPNVRRIDRRIWLPPNARAFARRLISAPPGRNNGMLLTVRGRDGDYQVDVIDRIHVTQDQLSALAACFPSPTRQAR